MKKSLVLFLVMACVACNDENNELKPKVNFSILTKYDWRTIDPDSTYADDGFVYSDTTTYRFEADMSVKTYRTLSMVIVTDYGTATQTFKLVQDPRVHEGTYSIDPQKRTLEIRYHKVSSYPDGEELENYLLIEPLAIIELNETKFVANFSNLFTFECLPLSR